MVEGLLTPSELEESAAALCRLRGLTPENFPEFDSARREIRRMQEVYQAICIAKKNLAASNSVSGR